MIEQWLKKLVESLWATMEGSVDVSNQGVHQIAWQGNPVLNVDPPLIWQGCRQ